jgi:hypothetical protein
VSRSLLDLKNGKMGTSSQHGASWLTLSASTLSWIAADSKGLNQWHTQSWDGSLSKLQHLLTQDIALAHRSIVLCPSLAKHWLQTPPLGVSSLSELHAVAMARAQHLFGSATRISDASETGWQVSGDWAANQAFLCVAWPAALSSLHLRLYTPLGIALAAYKSNLPAEGWCAITIANELHMMHIHHRRIAHLRSMRFPLSLSGKELEDRLVQEWQRDLLRTGAQAKSVHWLHFMPSDVGGQRNPALIPIEWRKSSGHKPRALEPSLHGGLDEAASAALAIWHIRGGKS